MKRSPTAGRQLSFQAKLENSAEGMDYCAVPVSASVTQTLGTKGPIFLVMARVKLRALQGEPLADRRRAALHSHQGKSP